MILETDRLRLRPLAAADLEGLVGLHGDAEVMRFITGASEPRAEVEAVSLPALLSRHAWAAHGRSGGPFLGWVSLRPCDGEAELGYRLQRTAWGRGLGGEAARAVVAAGFEHLGFARIWAQTMAVNLASRRVMEKAGLTYQRTFHQNWDNPLPGSDLGEVEYAATRSDWLSALGRDGAGPCPPPDQGEGRQEG